MSTQSIDQKRELLARRLRNQAQQTIYPLSHNQKALWFMNRLAPDSWAYTTLFTARIITAVDLGALERAFAALARRHAILRTTYHIQNGEPVQVVSNEPMVDLAVVDAASWSDQDVQNRMTQEAHRPFDLERGPVFRVFLLHLPSGEFLLLFAVHHIAVDYWSQSVLVEDLGVLYAAECGDAQASLPPLKAQYTDFVRSQADMLQSVHGEQQQAFWLERLGGELAVLNLPTDHQAPPVRAYRGATFTFAVESSLSDKLEAFARAEGVTLFVMLLAAYQVMLHRYSGQDDIVVGTPTAGRSQAEFYGVAGYFANPVVLRGDFSGAPSFRSLLQQQRTTFSEALASADYPFPLLVDRLQPQREPSRSPLFQALFALQRAPRLEQQDFTAFFMGDGQVSLNLGGLIMKSFPMQQQEGQFELKLYTAKSPTGLIGALQYSTDLFDGATIARMAGHYLNLLQAVVDSPDQPVTALPFLAAGERKQLLLDWNDRTKAYPPSHSLIDLFEAQVEQFPDAVALVFREQQLTYKELNRRANQVAHFLVKQGAGPEVLVGICLPRSLEMVISILGILKAGGAYVPLDPAYPTERLAFILQDAGVALLLSLGELVADLPDNGARLICMDTDWGSIERESHENPAVGVRPDNLAYVIYTSGSTGKPKGALITHHNVVRLFEATDSDFHFNQGDVWTLFHSFAFDFSVWEIWGALLHGGRLVIVPYWVSRSPEAFYDLLCTENVTVLNQTPSAFRQLMRAEEEERGTAAQLSLRLVIFGGEALEFQSLRPWFDRHGDQFPQLVNMYGITETTVHVTYRPLTAADTDGGKGSVIGRPLADLQVYVLDQHLEPAPIGVAGEMYVGGAGLARGYLNRPQLTEERFIPNPFCPGERLYKTGDLARFLSDGQLEYLGRMDDQVKIRGFRIELGEIESALCGHMGIREALVLVQADESNEKRLVAYVVPSANQTPTGDELRAHLKALLPDYMVPAVYLLLPAFPLTTNGKVDRRALPSPDQERPELAASYVAPRTPTEEMLAGIWAQVLGVARVGAHDDFFALGGHSLLATQIVSRLRESFGVEMPLQSLFQATTLAALAAEVDRCALSGGGRSFAPPIIPVGRDGELALSHAQERLWLVDQLEPGTATYSLPAALRMQGALQVGALEAALNEVVRRHESLRTVFAIKGGKPVQVIAPFQPAALVTVEADAKEPEALQRLIREEAQRPFDLATGPLLRTQLLRLAESEYVLQVTIHHIVADGWSVGLLIREVTALYAAFAAGAPSPLGELTVQYADFAVGQRAWLRGQVSDEGLAYWRRQLEGVQTLSLPTDRPRPSVPHHGGATESLTLPSALGERLMALSRQEGVTLFMTLLAAFQALLSRYSGQDDIAVGSPIANRNRVETEGLIGCFVNTLVLRTDLSGNPRFRELLRRVRAVTMGAYAHQETPFEKLVEALQPERNLSYSPLFQVAIALDNTPAAELELEGLTLSPFPVDTETAKFDLSLSLAERDGALIGTLEYSTALFDQGTAARMLGHFQVLLESIVTDPDQTVSDLSLLTQDEQQLLVAWNETAESYPRDRCIHELVSEHAYRTPSAVAVVYGERRLTYGELDRQANQLAHYLRRLGVGPDVLVGICAERSPEMVVGLLAIVKAGGAYLPLDPAYPAERLVFMLADAGVTVLVTQEGLLDRFSPSGVRLVCLDRDRAVVANESTDAPASGVIDTNLAYVIYTSGSTGQPKGVELAHGGLLNLLWWHRRTYNVTAADRATHLAGFAFDASVWEIWPYLTAGASLYLPDEETRLNPGGLRDWLLANRITLSFVPTPMAEQLLLLAWPARTELRAVLTGGDKLHRHPNRSLPFALINHYGPTENTVVATAGQVSAVTLNEVTSPSIGRPIANTQVYLLDRHRRRVPVGVPGELYIGGDGLALGYRNQPELTAERFIANPFSPVGWARLYKSGDLARYLPDGNIEFLGRIDDQVKVRGFRIELGEIEAALAGHGAVREVAVIAREDAPGDKRLVAYVVATADGALSVGELRRHLQEKVPSYMVPSAFVLLDRLPMTQNGKVDRRALPVPADVIQAAGDDALYAAPRSAVEERLAEIWSQVLRVARVGVHDNFFALGGDSILAIQVISRAAEAGLKLSPRQLFEHQTVAQLAAVAGTVGAVTAEQGPVTGPVPLTAIQHWFFAQRLPEAHHWNQAVLLETQPLNPAILERSIAHLLAHHDALRTRSVFTAEGVELVQDEVGDQVPFTLVDFTQVPDHELGARVTAAADELHASLSLGDGRLMCVTYFDGGAARSGRLLLIIHHLVVDGVSWRILLDDLHALYQQLLSGQPVRLPAKTTSFQEWSRRLAEHARLETLRQELPYWLAENRRRALPLPVDFSEGENTEATAHTVEVSLNSAETGALLRDVSKAYGSQINDVLLTALVRAFSRWTGERLLLVDLEGHGREELFEGVDLSRTVGWFSSQFPVLLEGGRAPNPGDAIRAVKEQLRTVPNRGIGYGLLRYLSGVPELGRGLASLPHAEVRFNYLGQFDQALPAESSFKLARESAGQSFSPAGYRSHLFDINCRILEDELRVAWTFSDRRHNRRTVEKLVQAYLQALRELIAHAQSPDAGGHVPSDFPTARLSQAALDRVLGKASGK